MSGGVKWGESPMVEWSRKYEESLLDNLRAALDAVRAGKDAIADVRQHDDAVEVRLKSGLAVFVQPRRIDPATALWNGFDPPVVCGVCGNLGTYMDDRGKHHFCHCGRGRK